MRAFERYESYRPSGIEWIGDIPSHWLMRKVSRSFYTIGSGTTPSSGNEIYYKDGNILWVNSGDLNNGYLSDTEKKVNQNALDDFSVLKMYEPNSLIIAMYGATIGKLAILQSSACTNQACCILNDSEFFEIKFVFYWFLANKQNIVNLSFGGGQPNISQDVIKSLKIQAPALEEQRQIVDFLDIKSKQVDEFIADKQALITLFEEQKSAIINDAVTKGLDKTAPLKPSGIEWVGDIPSHWEVKKLKYSIQIKSGIGITANELKEDGLYKVYGGNGDIGFYDKFNTVDEVLIIGRVGAKCGNVHHVNEKIWVSDNALIVETIENYAFMYHLLSSLNLNKLSTSTAQPLITGSDIKNYTVVLPPLEEQKQIVAYLETELAKIDTLIDTAKAEITLIEEYKTSLINEAVAGKIKIYNGANT